MDNANRIFLIFTRQEVQEKLGLSEKTVTKAFKQLVDTDLIEEKRQGLGKPNLIYVAKIQYEEKDKISDTKEGTMKMAHLIFSILTLLMITKL